MFVHEEEKLAPRSALWSHTIKQPRSRDCAPRVAAWLLCLSQDFSIQRSSGMLPLPPGSVRDAFHHPNHISARDIYEGHFPKGFVKSFPSAGHCAPAMDRSQSGAHVASAWLQPSAGCPEEVYSPPHVLRL